MHLILRVWVLISAWLLAACSNPLADTNLTPVDCHFDPVWEFPVDKLHCYRLSVPETRGSSNGRIIELGVYFIQARAASNEPPIIFLMGGPGESAEYTLLALKDHPIRDVRDLIVLEQRGTGVSNWFCPDWASFVFVEISAIPDIREQNRLFEERLVDCFSKARAAGVDIESYSTAENALDLVALRHAIQLDEIDIWAGSYGTVLAQAYMGIEAEAVGQVVFDGTFGVDHAWATTSLPAYVGALNSVEDYCRSQGYCMSSDRSVAERAIHVFDSYESDPEHLVLGPENTGWPGSYSYYLYGVEAAGFVRSLMYRDNVHLYLEEVLEQIELRSASFLSETIASKLNPFFSNGMYYAVRCTGPRATREQIEQVSNRFTEWLAAIEIDGLNRYCDMLGIATQEPVDPVFFEGDMLIMSGEWDPISPLALALDISDRFPNAEFLEIPFGGHVPSLWMVCAQQIVADYFAGLSPEIRSECEENPNVR